MGIDKEQFLLKFRNDSRIISVMAVDNPKQLPSLTDGFDILLLIVTNDLSLNNHTTNYIRDDSRIQERWVDPSSIEQWVRQGHNRNILHWLLKGEILLDQNTYLEGLRHRILEFPADLREHKLLVEFSLFLRKYLQSKEYILDEHLLDAYNNILEALHHWARIVIIEDGYHPEITVWRQIRAINPGVYKLYEELTMSKETLKQRVQLVLLACEFSVMSKMERCCEAFIQILRENDKAFSSDELQQHGQLIEIKSELPLLLNKLVKKGLIKEVAVLIDEETSEIELRYTSV
ncbi:nucleotidyltransferase-like protein [Paenibacillus chondroitinus]|uniref:Nucleotidyltransferase-like protein n=1 Tax=Paenibacillus chondroitinus TaxID=59842 RepID=A0ABU6DG84_9BACL|nr:MULTISPECIES: nucleotidyltransferase-like protein [Paenibacillus]MCY9663313.1 nucleotidyltransferase-like protein [Paenibacillus anseongense]MEB4796763.1 nucleotidyltransferase-like protein [Paenibacillus chondroitinus]